MCIYNQYKILFILFYTSFNLMSYSTFYRIKIIHRDFNAYQHISICLPFYFSSIFDTVINIAKYILGLKSYNHFSLFPYGYRTKISRQFLDIRRHCQTGFLKIFSDAKSTTKNLVTHSSILI